MQERQVLERSVEVKYIPNLPTQSLPNHKQYFPDHRSSCYHFCIEVDELLKLIEEAKQTLAKSGTYYDKLILVTNYLSSDLIEGTLRIATFESEEQLQARRQKLQDLATKIREARAAKDEEEARKMYEQLKQRFEK